ncbi:MAG: response regulator transcription factor [Bacteroidales bacterium]|nr:response regulator transcription factor [Bacteroidales bacterium]MBQ5958192.1 response regulator transcription factor [Bacteroidales bacterium]MBR6273030.1 response regulator transcription factor [Bacteroidales bacterium]
MTQKINALLVEDDKNLGVILNKYLEAKDINVTLCANGEEALETFRSGNFNFCIFDVMLPLMDGFTLAREVKKLNKLVPIIFLTAKTTSKDVIEGFKLGADDYITKPFNMDELLLRIHAVFNRTSVDTPAPTTFRLGSFTFDAARHLLIRGEETRKLTSKEADLLLLFCENMNETLERSVALRKVWYEDSYFNARSMDVYITKLRKYFKDDPNVDLINVHGVGFKLLVKN